MYCSALNRLAVAGIPKNSSRNVLSSSLSFTRRSLHFNPQKCQFNKKVKFGVVNTRAHVTPILFPKGLFAASKKSIDDIVKEVSTPPPLDSLKAEEDVVVDSKEADPDRVLPLYASISPKKLLIMSLATWGVYTVYWDWCQWNAIRNRTGQKLSPEWRAVFGFITCYSLFRRMNSTATGLGIRPTIHHSILFIMTLLSMVLPLVSFTAVDFVLMSYIVAPLFLIAPRVRMQRLADLMNERAGVQVVPNSEMKTWHWAFVVLMLLVICVDLYHALTDPSKVLGWESRQEARENRQKASDESKKLTDAVNDSKSQARWPAQKLNLEPSTPPPSTPPSSPTATPPSTPRGSPR